MITRAAPRRWVPLAALLAGAGTAHLVRPGGFDAIVPRALPGPARWWTTGSGVVELVLAAGLALPPTRRAAGAAAAAFLVAVWPANAQMAADAWRAPGGGRRAALVRAATLVR
ncbi:hypothetical protein, partial [Kineococcus vitellinus]|uniref:hypothetical protein n=1 Tax=Kineococcus vitellinus TaxID=2696565 RepID=UPI00196B071C